MEILGLNIGGGSGSMVVKKEKTFVLTPIGKEKVRTYQLDGRKCEVAQHLADVNMPCTIEEISNAKHMDKSTVKAILDGLMQTDYVTTGVRNSAV